MSKLRVQYVEYNILECVPKNLGYVMSERSGTTLKHMGRFSNYAKGCPIYLAWNIDITPHRSCVKLKFVFWD